MWEVQPVTDERGVPLKADYPAEVWYCNGSRLKPRGRGVSHELYLVFVWPVCAIVMLMACQSTMSYISALLHLLSTAFCLGASSQYHRRNWPTPALEALMGKLDYLGIFVFINFSYAPVGLLLIPWMGIPTLVVGGVGCVIGFIVTLTVTLSRLTTCIIFTTLGCIGLVCVPEFHKYATTFEITATWCMVAASVTGTCIFASQRPDPWPYTFGYREMFHFFVCVGMILGFAANYSVICRTQTGMSII
eukprot:c40330_g1_i1.p1 GENE.c40330_g1_i1~~c40330_g1_i1.p1  ORF type:complete len:247 (+),score=9.09 c40330_g1_i1:37-777(+)